MKVKNVFKKVQAIMAAIFLLLSPSGAAFASGGERSFPKIVDGLPTFILSRVDLTNNQLEFSVNINWLGEKVLSNFGAGYVTNRAAVRSLDVLEYDSVSNPWSERVFWSDNEDLSKYMYKSGGIDGWAKYVVDAESDLLLNDSGELFYLAEFADGDKWLNEFDYSECLSEWSRGMECDAMPMMNGNSQAFEIKYILSEAPDGKLMVGQTQEQKNKNEIVSGPESGSEPESRSELESGSEPEPENSEVVSELEPETNIEVETEALGGETTNNAFNIENADELEGKVDNEVVEASIETKKVLATKNSENGAKGDLKLASVKQTTKETKEIGDGVADGDVAVDTPEGPGETTLDVPTLGEASKIDFNWLPYFLGGAVLGWILTWFLVYIVMKKKVSYV